MKKAITIFAAILLLAVGATAQKLSYSAVVRNSANELVANANITVAVSVTDGTNTYAESHAVTTNANGLVTLTIGEGTGATGSLSGMNWPAASITATYTLPGGATVTNTVPVNAVPYALYAETAGSGGGGGGIVTETDPTVPAWAKEATKPAYDYSEITGTPTIPTVNDGTLTITLPDGTSETFTANQSGNTEVTIPAPAAMTAADLLALVNGMSDAEKEALRDALGVTGGSDAPTTFTCGTSKMTDADGNEYETVLIGTQCWTKTNLRVAPAGATDATSSGASSYTEPYYYVNSAVNPAVYGYYYNWEAAKLACPTGWHLPSDAEWTTLTDYVSSQSEYTCGGNSSYIAKALASKTTDWNSSSNTCAVGNNPSANNDAGFSAVPAGYCDGSSFDNAGFYAYFCSSTQYNSGYAWTRTLGYNYAAVGRYDNSKNNGYSVRCLRDETGGGGTVLTEPTVTTGATTSVTETSATLNGSVSNPDGVAITAQGFEWKATTGGTYAQVTATGAEMSYVLTGLTAGTSYTYRAFVTTAAGTSYGSEVAFTTTASDPTSFTCGTSKMTDADGNEYETVLIGTQCWTKTNLRVAPAGATDATSSGATSTTEPYYYVNSAVNPAVYGYYYNWEAAKLACPTGWHLPSDAEWTTLTDYVRGQSEYQCGGNSSYIAKALASTEGWNGYSGTCAVGDDPSANNASGFGAVPAGYCNGSSFYDAGYYASFWSSSEYDSDIAWYRYLYYYDAYVYRYGNYKYYGFSVRCLRDETGGGGTVLTEPTVTTGATTSVTETSATLNGSVSNPDGVAITAQGFEWKATTGGTYAQVAATGAEMSYVLTGLTAGTSYTYRAFVTTAAGTSYGSEVAFTTTASDPTTFTCGTSKMTDADGNEYETVLIGTQCWTKTNLRVAPAGATDATSSGATSYTEPYYYVNSAVNPAVYGYYYNWEAAKLACPTGWHLPSDAEWTTLAGYVSSQSEYTCGGNSSYIAKALASKTTDWVSSSNTCAVGNNPSANNDAGFSAVPAGYYDGSSFYSAGGSAYFWSSTQYNSFTAWPRTLYYIYADVYRNFDYKRYGFSVRCLRD